MLFTMSLEIPPNTTQLAPVTVKIPACEGTVTKVIVRWRWGSGNLCGCRVMYSEYQLWPRSKAQWFISNVQDYEFEENLNITDHPHFFMLDGYNSDDTFPHTVEVCVNVLRSGDTGALGAFLEYLENGPSD